MSITRFFGATGTVAGLAFGIYAATQNFDTDHQAESMKQATRVFSEILMQIGYASMQAGSLGLMAGAVGAVLDCLTCCKCVTEGELDNARQLANVV